MMGNEVIIGLTGDINFVLSCANLKTTLYRFVTPSRERISYGKSTSCGALNRYHNYDKTYNKQHATSNLLQNPITSTKKLASCKKWGGVRAGLGTTLSR